MIGSKARRYATRVALAALMAGASTAMAQEVVQPLPPPGSAQLGSALQRLARDANDLDALIDAGDASMDLGDVPAAIGFFGRAEALSPDNPRVALGLARAYTLSRRPVEALRLFDEAERGGVPLAAMAADRGLAFDLVGDARSAQDLYRLALSRGENSDVRRKLALSQAISGDKPGFEATLLPLLQQGDNAAFRTRAFGLAILGETDAAIKIARDMMPGRASAQIEPYLRYMAELTPAQQAAAGALGVFPRTSAIGNDDARIASYDRSRSSAAQGADRALAPAGPVMGSRPTASAARAPATQPQARPTPSASQPEAQTDGSGELPAITRTRTEAAPATRPAAQRPQPVAPQPRPTPAPPPPPPPPAPPPPRPARPDLAEAFAGFDRAPATTTQAREGAVDITRIEVRRERDEPPPPPPPPPSPSRHYVQLATGRDLSALGFDWRRITRASGGELAGRSAFTAPWGEANRLLAGPYDNARQARETVARLKAAGVDSFAFTSARGEEIFPLAGATPAPDGPPPPPAEASRHWVQIATGRDRKALGFDWRRISRAAEGELARRGPFVASWGATNRLLAGPYDSLAEAKQVVARLDKLDIDSFTFTSADGEAVEKLD